MNIEDFRQILQASIAPCVLISGLGLLLLSMTNRFARPTDRIRQLVKSEEGDSPDHRQAVRDQIRIFYSRAHFLRRAIGFISLSIFFVSLIMLMMFSSYLLDINFFVSLIKLAFTASLVCLIIALIFFFLDIRLTLRSLEIEAAKYLKK